MASKRTTQRPQPVVQEREATRRIIPEVRFFSAGQQVDEADFWMRVAEAAAGADTAENYLERRLEGLGDPLDAALERVQREAEYRIETLERRAEGRR